MKTSEGSIMRKFIFSFAIVVMAGLTTGCAKREPGPPPGPRAVRVALARTESAATGGSYAGSLEPRTRLNLAFGVPGRVRSLGSVRDGGKERPLREGDRVTKGQVLALLDDSDLQHQAASSSLAMSTASADLASSEASLAQAEADLVRARGLAASGAVPGAELERAETLAKAARGRTAALRAQKGSRGEQVAIARRAASDARLLSPIEGVIARRMVDAGESVGPSTIAFTVIDTREMKLVFGVPDTRIGAVHPNDLVPVHAEARGAAPLAGRVVAIQPVADPTLRTFAVEVAVDNAGGELRAGMVASASLGTDGGPPALLVPLRSIVRRLDGKLGVFRVERDVGRDVAVELGDLVGNDVVVRAGLATGDRVVTDGAPLLKDGERVEVLP